MRTATWVLAACAAAVPALAQAPRKYAILVGVGKYEHGKLDALPFAERDVAELAPILKAADYDVRLLTNAAGAADPGAQPTLANVERELAALLGRPDAPGRPGVKAKVAASDLVLIALAGHGLQPAGDQDSYFCPVDAHPQVKATLLSVGGLIRSLDQSGAGSKLLLVDACRNDPDPSRGRGLDGAAMRTLPQGVAALFSCSPGQRAFETAKAGGGHGVFFHFVLEGLKGAAANKRGEVTWAGLSEFVTERVEAGVHEWVGPDQQQTPGEFKNFRGRPPVLRTGLAVADRGKAEVRPAMPAPTETLPQPAGADYASRTIRMPFKLIPAGEFLMGAPDSERVAHDSEKPQHKAKITKPFYMGKTEVTQAQYRAVMNENPSHFAGDDLPVETVSWLEAVRFCNALSEKDGKRPCYFIPEGKAPEAGTSGGLSLDFPPPSLDRRGLGLLGEKPLEPKFVTPLASGNGYRLPTSAEWEYACRAGTTGPFGFEGMLTTDKVNYDGEAPYENAPKGERRQKPIAVGSLPANAFGLHEMHGNVAEWTWNAYELDYSNYNAKSFFGNNDPAGPASADRDAERIIRGGGWNAYGWSCRSASRHHYPPNHRDQYTGFRIVAVKE